MEYEWLKKENRKRHFFVTDREKRLEESTPNAEMPQFSTF